MTDRVTKTQAGALIGGTQRRRGGGVVAVLLSFLMCFPPPAFAGSPASVQLTYDVFKDSLRIGKIQESYARDGGEYTLTSTTRAVGLLAVFKPGRILVNSNGLVTSRGLQPMRYTDRREGEERRNRSAEFDWKTGQLTMIHQAARTVVTLPKGTQDRLSAMYQFMYLAPLPSGTLDFPMTNGSKLDNYRFAVSAGKKLTTPAGEFDTLYLDSQPQKGENRTEIWLATEHYNLPVKMTITDADGGQLTQILSKLSVAP